MLRLYAPAPSPLPVVTPLHDSPRNCTPAKSRKAQFKKCFMTLNLKHLFLKKLTTAGIIAPYQTIPKYIATKFAQCPLIFW